MKIVRSSFLLLALFPFSVACGLFNSAPGTTPAANSGFDAEKIQEDIRTGKLKFEIRGLANEGEEKSYGGKSFTHSAVIIPVGDSKYLKGDYLLMCSIKRLSGGDPENARKSDDFAPVFVHNGMGRLAESGGYKGKDEKWEPEKVEVRPEVVFVGVPTVGTGVQE